MTKYTCKCVRAPSERPVFWEKDGVRYCTSCKSELVRVESAECVEYQAAAHSWDDWRDEGEAGA